MKRNWLVTGVLLLGCGCTSMSHTEEGAATGGIVGAAAGGLIGAAAHAPVAGALIGAGTGALIGGAAGNAEDRREDRAVRQAAAAQAAAARTALSLEDVVNLVQQHIDESIIITQIRQSSVVYRLTGDQIIWLKQQGVSDAIVRELQAHTAVYVQPAPVVIYRDPPPVAVGVGYYRRW
jgi:hypothetical protein